MSAPSGPSRTRAHRPQVPLPPEQISIEERIEQLLARLSETEACGFDDLFDDVATRADLIVTFLALLEMIRLKLVRVFQSGALAPSASTSARVQRTRRIRSTTRRTNTGASRRCQSASGNAKAEER